MIGIKMVDITLRPLSSCAEKHGRVQRKSDQNGKLWKITGDEIYDVSQDGTKSMGKDRK